MTPTPLKHEQEILDTPYAMFSTGDVIEIRMMRRNGTTAGYYDYEHFPKSVHDVAMYDEMRDNSAVYYTCNPVKAELHPRAFNTDFRQPFIFHKETTTFSSKGIVH
ncbi:MAG TPA: hypothetical protein C5S50_02695 [Methanosarcinaceae archaeon]|nr:hypothetical protein [Methanosarcinaceae archaeon]